MYLLRNVTLRDLPDLSVLAKSFNTVNLPDDQDELRAIVEHSVASFDGSVTDPFAREFVFVLEDREKKQVIGTSQIMAQHGTRDAPHVYLNVTKEEKYSPTTKRYMTHKVLTLGLNYNGPTEIGGLILHPDYRRAAGKLGKQLSFIRFVFMAMRPSEFRDSVLAELLPPLGKDGRSALWDALGQRFTGMDYREADLISKHNKDFIKNLFPSGHIYATLFSEEAQAVIGEVGEATKGVKRMLENIGFQQVSRVDPFDGGPHFRADTNDIWPITNSLKSVVAKGDKRSITKGPGQYANGLVARSKDNAFAATRCDYRVLGQVTEIPEDAMDALALTDGDEIYTLAFSTHTRH